MNGRFDPRRRVRFAVCWYLGISALATALSGNALCTDLQLRHVDVFRSGADGYHTFRIPSIAVSANGVLLAFAEGRVDNAGDPGTGNTIDTVFKRSLDGGQTWSAMQVLAPGGPNIQAFQPTTVVDRANGRNRVWAFYNYRNPDLPPGREQDIGLFSRYSDDDGLTWSSPQSYEHLRPSGTTNFTANIASGLQMTSGRLVVPMKTQFAGTESQPSVLYSDDHGTTWALGGLMPPGTNEHQIVEISDGVLLSNQRPNTGTTRRINVSHDGGQTWGDSMGNIQLTPVSAGIERYAKSSLADSAADRILFTGPIGGGVGGNRSKLTVFTSADDGMTYSDPRIIYHGPAAYSDIARNDGDYFGVLWERGDTANYQSITYTSANRAFIELPSDLRMIAEDSFDYAPGPLGRAVGGNGFNSTWLRDVDLTDTPNVQVAYGPLPNQQFSTGYEGNHIRISGGSMSRGLGIPLDLDHDQSYYIALQVSRSADTTANDDIGEFLDIHLLDASGASQLDFGISSTEEFRIRGLSDEVATSAGSAELDETYLLLLKIESQSQFNSSGFDQAFLKAFRAGEPIPESGDSIEWTVIGNTTENRAAELDRLRITGGSNAIWLVDELRVGMDYASVALGPVSAADLNGDRTVDHLDWLAFRGQLNASTMAHLPDVRRTMGDFDLNGKVGPEDFQTFVNLYHAFNGPGTFTFGMVVPEMSTGTIAAIIAGWFLGQSRLSRPKLACCNP